MPEPIIDLDDTEENEDWIKTPENRASEAAIHDELARQIQQQQPRKEPA